MRLPAKHRACCIGGRFLRLRRASVTIDGAGRGAEGSQGALLVEQGGQGVGHPELRTCLGAEPVRPALFVREVRSRGLPITNLH